jgi:ketosteroid isomerase-like protein
MPEEQLETELSPVTVVESDASTADELRQRVTQWDVAVRARDESAAADLLAPDFALELVQPVRNVMNRQEWLEVLADDVVGEWDVEEQIVEVDGDVGLVLRRVRLEATAMGEDRGGVFVMSDVWRRIDGEWRVWRRHSTPLIAARPRDRKSPD